MYMPILLAALVTLAPQERIIPVDRGTRLDVDNFRGEVVVDTWGRSEVRIDADLSNRQELDAALSGSTLRVRARHRNGGPAQADFRITVPAWMDVRIEGNQVDVDVVGTEGEVHVETVGGDIRVDGGRGLISVRSIQGEVVIRNARGRIEASSVNDEVTVVDVEGEVDLETTNGDVTMRSVSADRVRATTVNGDLEYSGPILDTGRYRLSTHNGDIEVTVSEDANVSVAVSTFHGEFESDFPVRFTGTTGQARLELESFNGEIQLRSPR